MTSILAAQPITLPTSNIMAQLDASPMPHIQDPSIQRRVKMEPTDKNRGRRRSRVNSKNSKDGAGDTSPLEDEGVDGHSSGSDAGNPRKRRRSRKGLDKKFECPQEGCGKSYSRAEHL
jgi:hypothetical protein